MIQDILNQSLIGLRKAETIYDRVVQLSGYIFREEELENKEDYLRELKYLLEGVKGVDTILTIFNHKTYLPELEVGQEQFWGLLPHETQEVRMKKIFSILHKDYTTFHVESINWFNSVISKIPFTQKGNMKIHHCCMRFIKEDGKQIRLFSQGVPIQLDEERHFQYTLNYVQNIDYAWDFVIKSFTTWSDEEGKQEYMVNEEDLPRAFQGSLHDIVRQGHSVTIDKQRCGMGQVEGLVSVRP